MESITLKKIAKNLGLSISTVSRALKDHPDISVSTKKRVHELAAFLDYEPNLNAINLRAKKNRFFGLLVPTISGFFYDSFISAIEEECRKNGYPLMILQSGDDPNVEMTNLSICRQNRVSGVFACLSSDTINMTGYQKILEAEIPLVFFDKVPVDDIYDKVCIADEEAATLAASQLFKANKKHILCLYGNHSHSITQERKIAFSRFFVDKPQITLHSEYCRSSAEARVLTNEYLSKKEKPDAVFCMSDEILTGVMKSLNGLKIEIPEEVSVISLSDGFLPGLYTPEITYIETSGYKLGKLAFERMLTCINGRIEPLSLYSKSFFVKGGSL